MWQRGAVARPTSCRYLAAFLNHDDRAVASSPTAQAEMAESATKEKSAVTEPEQWTVSKGTRFVALRVPLPASRNRPLRLMEVDDFRRNEGPEGRRPGGASAMGWRQAMEERGRK